VFYVPLKLEQVRTNFDKFSLKNRLKSFFWIRQNFCEKLLSNPYSMSQEFYDRYSCGHLVSNTKNKDEHAKRLPVMVDGDYESCKSEKYCERAREWADVVEVMNPSEWAEVSAQFATLKSPITLEHPEWPTEAVDLEAERLQVEAFERGEIGRVTKGGENEGTGPNFVLEVTTEPLTESNENDSSLDPSKSNLDSDLLHPADARTIFKDIRDKLHWQEWSEEQMY